jgi:Uncharacterized protein predicted to be involved in DNA repair (RAMP superfamily)
MGRVKFSVKLILLKFATPFKIGNGENYIDAITIYRALIKALSFLGEPFDDIINGRVKFSSTFPYKGELFIKIPFREVKCQDRKKEKEIMSIQYVSLKTYEEIEPPYVMNCEGDKIIIQGKNKSRELRRDEILESYGKFGVDYRNRMDRLFSSSDPYSMPYFMPAGQLAFLSSTWNNKLEEALKLLEMTGIGGDRNLGYGKFKVVGYKDIDVNMNYEYKYATGRAYTESEFKAERFDARPIIGGDIQINLVSQLLLLPLGSLVKDSKRIVVGDTNSIRNTVIIDPILL